MIILNQSQPAPTHGVHDIAAKLDEKLTNDNEGQLLTEMN